MTPPSRPGILFLCTHNAGRSQMAAAFAEATGLVDVYSGGSEPAEQVNLRAVEAMAEIGIDIAGRTPRAWTRADLETVDVVVTMGCGDTCPVIPGKRYVDWAIADPAEADLPTVRAVRDAIREKVLELTVELTEGEEPDAVGNVDIEDAIPDESETTALYGSVGWTAYTSDPANLHRSIRNSDWILSARNRDGELVGMLRAITDHHTIVYVQDLLVSPTSQRTGVGSALMSALLERAQGIRQVVLLTDHTTAQRSFYQSLGLVEVSDVEPAPLRAFVRLG